MNHLWLLLLLTITGCGIRTTTESSQSEFRLYTLPDTSHYVWYESETAHSGDFFVHEDDSYTQLQFEKWVGISLSDDRVLVQSIGYETSEEGHRRAVCQQIRRYNFGTLGITFDPKMSGYLTYRNPQTSECSADNYKRGHTLYRESPNALIYEGTHQERLLRAPRLTDAINKKG